MQMDTTKAGVIAYLDAAKKNTPTASRQAIHKLAVCKFILDAAGVKDAKVRAEAWKQFDATNAAFGCNGSALEQAFGLRTPKEARIEALLGDI